MARFVFVDEAGISNPQQEPFLVVAGVIVDADRQLNELERRLSNLADKFIPPDQRPGFVFHAKELFNGGKVFRRDDPVMTREVRWKIATELAKIPGKMQLPIAFGVIQRARFPLSLDVNSLSEKERKYLPVVTAYMNCAMDVERWMRAKHPHEVAMMVAEDSPDAREMIKSAQNSHRNPAVIEGQEASLREYFPFKKIKGSPLFEGKADSPALQMADFCAYVIKKRAMNNEKYASVFSALHPMFVRLQLDGDECRKAS